MKTLENQNKEDHKTRNKANQRLDNEHREQRALNTMVNEELNKTGECKHRKYQLRITGTKKHSVVNFIGAEMSSLCVAYVFCKSFATYFYHLIRNIHN